MTALDSGGQEGKMITFEAGSVTITIDGPGVTMTAEDEAALSTQFSGAAEVLRSAKEAMEAQQALITGLMHRASVLQQACDLLAQQNAALQIEHEQYAAALAGKTTGTN